MERDAVLDKAPPHAAVMRMRKQNTVYTAPSGS